MQVGGLDFKWLGISLPRTATALRFPDLILSSFATVSEEVNFFKAVSQAAALTSVWNTQSLYTLIASFGQTFSQAEQKMQNSPETLGLSFSI